MRARRRLPLISVALVLTVLWAGAAHAQVGGESGLLGEVVIKAGDRRMITTTYPIGRLVVADDSICRGAFTVRSTSLEVTCSTPGQTEFAVYDVAERLRDRFVSHVLGSEAWVLYEEMRARLGDMEGLAIEVDGPYVRLVGQMLSLSDVRRVVAEAGRSDWIEERVSIDPFALVVLYGPRARYRATYEMVDEYDFRHWHTHKHLHAVIRVEDVVVLVIRTEGSERTIEDRARRIVGRLNQALLTIAQGFSGNFRYADERGTAHLVFDHDTGDQLDIAEVYRGDIIGYARRSLGVAAGNGTDFNLTGQQIVDWWGRLITDAADLYIRQAPPRLVAQTAGGSLLLQLYERTLARGGGAYSPLLLKEIIAQTPPDERNLLEAMGARVPSEYLLRGL